MTQTMQHRVDGELLILVHGESCHDDGAWDAYLDDLRSKALAIARVKTLVVTAGGAPTTRQRNKLNAILAGRPTRVAVISSALLARGATLSLAWLNSGIRVFSPDESDRAFAHLQIEPERRPALLALVEELRRALAPAASAWDNPRQPRLASG